MAVQTRLKVLVDAIGVRVRFIAFRVRCGCVIASTRFAGNTSFVIAAERPNAELAPADGWNTAEASAVPVPVAMSKR